MTSRTFEGKPWNITPEPEVEYEARLIIWKTEDIEMMDFEGTSDVYVRSFLDADHDYITDTHWRCQNGKASFNWRNKILFKSKQPDYNITIQAWDKDLIASDDLIGEFTLDIQPLFYEVYITEQLKVLSEDYWNNRMKKLLQERGYKHIDQIEWDSKEKDSKRNEFFWIPVWRKYDAEKDGKDRKPDKNGMIHAGKI